VIATSSGDTTVTPADAWVVIHDPTYSFTTPQAIAWWDGAALAPTTETLATDNVTTTFNFSVPAGQTAALMIFAVQNTTAVGAQATAEWLMTLPDAALENLSTDEMIAIRNWQAGGAPVIRLVTEPPLEVEEGGSLPLEVYVEDLEGDAFTVYWELTGDGAFDDGTGTTATFEAVGYDGPTTAVVQVRAQDATEERIVDIDIDVLNAPPVFVSDPAVDPGLDAYRGRLWEYQLVVEDPANADGTMRDPVLVTVTDKPTSMIYFGDQHFEWTPRDADVGRHLLRIEADDRDSEEPAVQEVYVEVHANAPPGAPTIVSPSATVVAERRPTLVVQNAEDLDGDMLSYTFEVARTGDFAASSMVARGDVFETLDQTSWVVNADLMDATRYYWRVWANDGRNDGPSASTFFDVDLSAAPDEPTDASTDTVDDWMPPMPTPSDSSCGCRTVPGASSGAPLVVLALALAALVLRRRSH
jgi:MYXO-CTERM domain-containing protein